MVKTLIAIAVAGAFALPLAAHASGSDNIVLAQAGGGGGGGGDASTSTRQPGATPPGSVSPGTPRSAATGADRDTGADRHANPSGSDRSTSGSFERLDKNHDGFISRDEGKDAPELNTRFTELDQNNDGKLSPDEYNALNASARGATGTGAMGGKAGGTSSTTK